MADHRSILIELENMASDIEIQRAAVTVHTMQWARIFEEGKDSAGNALPPYSNDPIYVNTAVNSPKTLPSKGKTGQTKFKSGRPHVTTYFGGGYNEFKNKIGRLKLELFGFLRKSYVPGTVSGKPAYGFSDAHNAKVAEALEEKYKTEIFFNSDQETDLFIKLLTE